MSLAIPATASAAVGDEMLSNPGAENGSLGWDQNWWANYGNTPAPTFTVSSDAHSGTHSLRVDWSNRIGGQYDGDAKWAQGPFNVVGGHYYSYSDWYKSSGNTELAVWVNTTTNPDAPGKWYNLDIGIGSSSEWKQYSSGFQMPANATQAVFVHVLDDNGFLQTDDASMIDQGTTAQGFNRPIVTITQDDGTPDVKNTAIPALDAHGFKSTQFTISGVLNKSGEWTSDDVRNIAADGHEIGSHSVTHNDEVTGTDINGNPGTITLPSKLPSFATHRRRCRTSSERRSRTSRIRSALTTTSCRTSQERTTARHVASRAATSHVSTRQAACKGCESRTSRGPPAIRLTTCRR